MLFFFGMFKDEKYYLRSLGEDPRKVGILNVKCYLIFPQLRNLFYLFCRWHSANKIQSKMIEKNLNNSYICIQSQINMDTVLRCGP